MLSAGKLIYNENNETVFSFGNHKGQRVIHKAEYAGWILCADCPADTKTMIRQLLNIAQYLNKKSH